MNTKESKAKKFNPQGYKNLSNSGGIEIEIDDNSESVRYRMYNGKVSRPCKINYNMKGDQYFMCRGIRYYLSEFMSFNR